MKVSYRREMKYNYMIIDPEEITWRAYECRMMEGNAIEGLLKFQVRQSNGETQFYYEITSRQPLRRLLENRTISGEEIRRLVIGISNVLDQLERFLLDESRILLDPDYIYIEPESFRIWLCLVPGLERDFPDAYGHLLEYILRKVNHQDKDGVVLAYGLYQETRKENYGIEDILRLIQSHTPSDLPGKEQVEARERDKRYEQAAKDQDMPGVILPDTAEAYRVEGTKKGDAVYGCASAGNKTLWAKLKLLFSGKGKKEPMEESHQLPWQAMFLEEEVMEPPAMLPAESSLKVEPGASLKATKPPASLPPSDFVPGGQDTVLLSDLSPRETVRKLRALDEGEKDIAISYYPFIIGKQENLADYILSHDTVSRLHLRIDRQETEYQIMDLNSTNGTVVRGTLLENNESVALYPGDEVQIAKYRFRFE